MSVSRLPVHTIMLAVSLSWSASAQSADIGRRTTIACVTERTEALTSVTGRSDERSANTSNPGRIRSRFGQWLLSRNQDQRSSPIRFLWRPRAPTGPRLEIVTTQTHHVLVKVRSQDHNSVVAVSSASDPFSIVGWLFSINFRLEQIVAAVVRSNAGGVQSQAVRFSCNFEDKTPQADQPARGNGIG